MFDIIVIGGTNVDIKAKTAGRHIAGTSNPGVVNVTSGGVGRNISHNLGLLGMKVALISVVGEDAFGEIAVKATLAAGVETSMCLRNDLATGSYIAVLDSSGELVSAVNDMRILESLTCEFVKQHKAALDAAKFVVVDCNVRQDVLEYLALHFGEKLVVEPVSVAKSEKLKALLEKHEIFLATPNRDQLVALTGSDDVSAACQDLHERGLQNLVVHLGAAGSSASNGNRVRDIEAVSQSYIRDVTGAGDAAVAGLVYGLCKGYDVFHAAEFGQAAASLKVNSSLSTAIGLTEEALQTIVRARNE